MSDLTNEDKLRWIYNPAGFRWLRVAEPNEVWFDGNTLWRDVKRTSWPWRIIFGFTLGKEQFSIKSEGAVTYTTGAAQRVFYLDVSDTPDGISLEAPADALLVDSIKLGMPGTHPKRKNAGKVDHRKAEAVNDVFRQFYSSRELIESGDIQPTKTRELDFIIAHETKVVCCAPQARHCDYWRETLCGVGEIGPAFLSGYSVVAYVETMGTARCRLFALPTVEGAGFGKPENVPVGWQAVSPSSVRAGRKSKPPQTRRWIPPSVAQRQGMDKLLVACRDYHTCQRRGLVMELPGFHRRVVEAVS